VERLMEEATALFPEARAAMIASDVIAGPSAAAELIGRIASVRIDAAARMSLAGTLVAETQTA
jgi:primosomal protein N' (replication factor Y)